MAPGWGRAMMSEARYPWLGRDIEDTEIRGDWAAAVETLAASAGSHWVLSEFAFHGTTARRAARIATRGMREGKVMIRDAAARASGTPYRFVPGTHWAVPAVAAYYADDRWDADGRVEGDRPALLVVARSALLQAGQLVADLPGTEMPCDTRTGGTLRDEAEYERLDAEWRSTPGGWADCLQVYGSFCCLGRPRRSDVLVVLGVSDASRLIARYGSEPPSEPTPPAPSWR